MKKNILFIFLTLNLWVSNLIAQNLVPIQLDRPDQTECPFITPTKYIQFESGLTYENKNKNEKSLSYPTILWKYGVNTKFELRLITELVREQENTTTNIGLKPITIGFKASLFEQKGVIPKTSFIGHITTAKIGSKVFESNYISPSFRFNMQHDISERLMIAYNLGAKWDGATAQETYLYTLTTGLTITKKISFYIEVYGFQPRNNVAEHLLDGGFIYLINNNFMMDISGGVGLSKNAAKNYASLGLSYRFKTTRN